MHISICVKLKGMVFKNVNKIFVVYVATDLHDKQNIQPFLYLVHFYV